MRYVYKKGTKESQLIIEGMSTPVADLIRVNGEWRDPVIDNKIIEDKKKEDEQARILAEYATIPISELGINPRAANALKRNNIEFIGQLITHSREEVSSFRNLGDLTLKNIEYNLSLFGLALRDSTSSPEPVYKNVAHLVHNEDGTYSIEKVEE